jgi:type I restriction enzyme S subunit
MEVRPGYKQTEVGAIPEDWQLTCLGAYGETYGGLTGKTKKDFGTGDAEYVTFMNVISNVVIDHDSFDRVHIGPAEYQNRVRKNDLLFNGSSETPEEVAFCAVYLGDSPDLYLNSFCFGYRLRDQRVINPLFLAYLFRSRTGRELVKALAQGSTRYNISKRAFLGAPLALPPIQEQRAIASALSDVDALLGALDRLIAKKRDLKQAAMQQLLTGQTRLPGFHGEWEVKRLGDHVAFLRNGVNSRAELLPEGRVKYLHYGDIHASTDPFLSPQALPSLPDAKAARLDRLRDGDVIFADASEDIAGVSTSVELRGARETEVVSGLHTIAARFDKTVLADGFKGYLQHCPSFATHLRRLAAGTKVYATNRAHIASVEMRLPSVAEQVAIAAVLSDMDAELAAIEARRDKTRALKQAMMQELLTGRTRLVRSEDREAAAC